MPRPKTLRLILGDQLNARHTWFEQPDKQVTFVLMEIRQETDYVTHHIQKVTAFFAAMRAFADHLRKLGHKVIYLKLDDPGNLQSIDANIATLLNRFKFARFEYLLPDEHRLDIQMRNITGALPVPVRASEISPFV